MDALRVQLVHQKRMFALNKPFDLRWSMFVDAIFRLVECSIHVRSFIILLHSLPDSIAIPTCSSRVSGDFMQGSLQSACSDEVP